MGSSVSEFGRVTAPFALSSLILYKFTSHIDISSNVKLALRLEPRESSIDSEGRFITCTPSLQQWVHAKNLDEELASFLVLSDSQMHTYFIDSKARRKLSDHLV